ncbi:MAG: 1-aminocyclopropane-1-carboxylate deaminase [Bacteroidetes bacterium]|nr:1-aminocyclopropane-1-carboxylate deaminase [Bacteroidota bacterium]MBK9354413.1 1-aminocyclopropane-1-carboxylate deaminase [Bacteroidota bacterium]MBP7256901.1 hypothetical protein [Chitinophagales bacterium]
MTKTHHEFFPINLCDESLLFHSRVHALSDNEYPDTWIKREDESSFGISGSKKRKYASLIPFLKKNKFDCVGVIGGSNSNNVIGLVQLLIENQLNFKLFLKTNNSIANSGNGFLLSLLSKKEKIIFVNQTDWPNVEIIAQDSLKKEYSNFKTITEGSSCIEAFPGALTMAVDIIKNEKEQHLKFNHVFIDAGTCLMATALCLEFSKLRKETCIHIVLMAEDETYFSNQLVKTIEWATFYNLNYQLPANYILYKPITAKSFGSVNATVLDKTKEYAQKYGILTDPIYSTKLFMTALNIIKEKKLLGNKLIIHSGGGQSLFGFQDKILNIK